MTTLVDITRRRNGDHVTDHPPTCSKCGGKGYQLFCTGWTPTGSGFGDADEQFEPRDCDVCDGDGQVNDDASLIASVTYELEPWLDVLAIGQWAACHLEEDEGEIHATFRWDAMIAWVTPEIRAVAGEVLVRHGFEVVEVASQQAATHRAMYWDPGPDAA
jgi:hypothetical protein